MGAGPTSVVGRGTDRSTHRRRSAQWYHVLGFLVVACQNLGCLASTVYWRLQSVGELSFHRDSVMSVMVEGSTGTVSRSCSGETAVRIGYPSASL